MQGRKYPQRINNDFSTLLKNKVAVVNSIAQELKIQKEYFGSGKVLIYLRHPPPPNKEPLDANNHLEQ